MAAMQPLKSLTLRQNFSWTFVGNIIYAASQWGMLVVLAKLGSPEMVGQFMRGLAVTAPIILFSNLQLRQIQTTDVKQHYAVDLNPKKIIISRTICVEMTIA
jgi:O-antigen/teichoic acid export membrane protein